MPLEKPLDQLTEDDLKGLVVACVSERKILDYKEALPGGSDENRKEFLADVSSFANTAGGHLVFGVKEDQGLPTELCGLGSIDPDEEIRRLESMARSGLDPKIPALDSHEIRLASGGYVIVMRIPKSWQAPHRVVFKNSGRFWSRSSKGKHELDVRELRSAFVTGEAMSERIRAFRADRVIKVMGAETPVQPLPKGLGYLVHIVSMGSYGGDRDLAIPWLFENVSLALSPRNLPWVNYAAVGRRINVDGVVAWKSTEGEILSYAQVYRAGALESLFVVPDRTLLRDDSAAIYREFEAEVLRVVKAGVKCLSEGGAEAPYAILFTLIGTKGRSIVGSPGHALEMEELLLPDVVIEGLGEDFARSLKPAFDIIWNAAGMTGSGNYDDAGSWVGESWS